MVPNTIDLTSVQTLKKVIYSESFRLGSFWCLKCKTFLIIIYCKLFSLCFLTENDDMPSEMDDIQIALNQAAKSSGENFNTITLSRKYIHVKRWIFCCCCFSYQMSTWKNSRTNPHNLTKTCWLTGSMSLVRLEQVAIGFVLRDKSCVNILNQIA